MKEQLKYQELTNPELVEDEYFRPHDTAVISIPQKAPEGAIMRTESPFHLLDRIKKVHLEWVKPGHRTGNNTHNVSATVSLRDEEWDLAGDWMWDNRAHMFRHHLKIATKKNIQKCQKLLKMWIYQKLQNQTITQIFQVNQRVQEELVKSNDWIYELYIKEFILKKKTLKTK